MQQQPFKKVMPIITVDSVDEVREFYVGKLGFDHVMGVIGKDGLLDFCTVVMGGARIMFARPLDGAVGDKSRSQHRAVQIYFEVADVQKYHDKLKQTSGVKIVDALTMQWWGDRTFKVQDPAGYEVWFYQTVGEPKPPQGAKIV
jgi:uncharacterized glyoxalase superfamily protein PhnB